MQYIDGSSPAPAKEIDGGPDGKQKVPNPGYTIWLAYDQQVFSYLVASLSRDVLKQVASCVTATDLWKPLEELFASQTQARAVNTRIALANTKKGATSVDEYVGKMRALGDEMAAAGKPIDDEELVSYICTGLDIEFNPVVSAILARVEPISVTELYSQLLAFEQRMELLHGSTSPSANAATRGRGGYNRGRGNGSGGRGNNNRGHGNGSGG